MYIKSMLQAAHYNPLLALKIWYVGLNYLKRADEHTVTATKKALAYCIGKPEQVDDQLDIILLLVSIAIRDKRITVKYRSIFRSGILVGLRYGILGIILLVSGIVYLFALLGVGLDRANIKLKEMEWN